MSELAAGIICFAGGAIVPLASLAIAVANGSRAASTSQSCRRRAAPRHGGVARSATPLLPAHGSTALVCLSLVIGTNIGRRIQHPGHLLPACVVVASADMVSVSRLMERNYAIAANEQALALLAIRSRCREPTSGPLR